MKEGGGDEVSYLSVSPELLAAARCCCSSDTSEYVTTPHAGKLTPDVSDHSRSLTAGGVAETVTTTPVSELFH